MRVVISATAGLEDFGAHQEILGTGTGLFGSAVAVSGDYALIGHPDYQTRGIRTGTAYVYARQAGRWLQVAQLLPSQAGHGARFGSAVALSGTIALIGADGENAERGAAYLYEHRQGVWTLLHTFTLSNSAAQTYLGQSVALAGDYAMVGAPGDTEAGVKSGAVYVYERQQGNWSAAPIQKLFASDASAYYNFGTRLAMTDSTALIGSPDHGGGTAYTGAAYIFELDRGVWLEVARLRASTSKIRGTFGAAVALNADTAAVGAPMQGPGAVYLFTRQGSAWTTTEVQRLTSSSDGSGQRFFGRSVALSDDVLLVGAPAALYEWYEPGGVYVFERQATGWVEVAQVPAPQEKFLFALFGSALALNHSHALVGHTHHISQAPSRVYAYSDFRRNAAPAITSTPQTTATVGRLYRYAVQASDIDGQALVYGLTSAPAGMLIDATSGAITWTPTAPGMAPVVIAVHDNHGGTATQAYSIVVSAPNQPPQITSTPITSTEVFHVTPQVTVSDAHLVQHTITLNGQPYTPGTPITAEGEYILTVAATDAAGNSSTVTRRFTITRPPVP